MKRVVAVVGVQADLDVVAFPAEFFEDGANLVAEVTL